MRRAATLVLFAACAAPQPYPLREMEDKDRAFQPAPAADAEERVLGILRQPELTLSDVLEIADRRNPAIESERGSVDLATAAIWQARLYPNPALFVQVEDARTSGGSLSDSKRTGGIRIPVVLSGRIGVATSLGEKEREIAAVRYVWRRREILSDVKRAFLDVLASKRAADLARETRDLAAALHKASEERFQSQAIPEMELLKAAVNLAKAESDLRSAEKTHAVSIQSLRALLGDIDLPHDRFAGDLFTRFAIPELATLRKRVEASHPLLEESVKEREAAELQLSLYRLERWPDVGLEFSGGVDSEGEAIVQGGLEFPLPVFTRNQGKVLAAEIRIRQAELRSRATRNSLLLALTRAYRECVASQERVLAYKDEILPKAQTALNQTNEGYRLGKFGYLDLLDAQRTLAEAKIAFVTALAELNLAATELEKITGMRLESIR